MPRKVNEQTEKLTVNINHVDLGKIDLLVENGFFSNRSDFIRSAVRSELEKNSRFVEEKVISKSYSLGIFKLDKKELEGYLEKNKMIEAKMIGFVRIADDVTLDLMKKTVKSLEVKGSISAPKDIEEYYDL